MNKSDIVRTVYEKLDKKISMKDLDLVLNTTLDLMADALKKGEEVQLADFGTFSLANKTIKPMIKSVKKKK